MQESIKDLLICSYLKPFFWSCQETGKQKGAGRKPSSPAPESSNL